ncbi:rifin PIR protein, putative [Plasmodium reichenowi]|uniref:Rifin PIR protein, putative n=1 Tax=Plasmodium reichenowi TaxID=5854 RepID=A0A2P9D3Z7_PLARE|nr:rifin PIR protein, putative [Plasmodium reichenowi]
MKLHYTKILLFFFPLNILITSYHVHNNKNKPYITPGHIQTNRSLYECNTQSLNYDNDAEMKSVKEIFNLQTSQRFEEYEERMKDKRRKRKEERDKNIKNIIEKDKREKSLAEKIEKGCLRCGCALGGGVLPVWGLVSGLWYATLSQHVTKLAIQKGIKKGIEVGLVKVREIASPSFTGHGGFTIPTIEELETLTTGISGDNVTLHGIFQCINNNISGSLREAHQPFFTTVKTMAEKPLSDFNRDPLQSAAAAVEKAFAEGEAAEFASNTSLLSNTIIASVVTILVIVLVMIIVYLILRYRRKKKMKKKAQYTKLLNQ